MMMVKQCRSPLLTLLRGACVALALMVSAHAAENPANMPSSDDAALIQKLEQSQMPPRTEGFVHIQDQKERVLIQPDGRIFRDVHSIGQYWVDAAMILVAVLSMAGLYFAVGSMRVAQDARGRTILRFTGFERFIHWLVASCFIVLGLTGLNLVFGRSLIQPWMGDLAFAEMTHLGKLAHNFLAFPFAAGLAVLTIQWLIPNIPDRLDWMWIKMAGGMFGGPHPPARKFNAGQKMIYWCAVFGGGALVVTGAALMLPFAVTDILGMQVIQVAHSLIAAAMIAIIIGHIYLGTIGVRGSFAAMSTGRVDLNWAREHHAVWVAEEIRKGRIDDDAFSAAE
jgi:formate dehydrogenase subunit gamma